MNRTHITYAVATMIGIAAGAALACRDQTGVAVPPPPPSALSLRLHSPNTNDGAVFVELRGPAIKTGVTGSQGAQLFTSMVGDTLLRAVVVGSFPDAALITVPVGAGHSAASYSARVIEVADVNGVLRSGTNGYSVTIESP